MKLETAPWYGASHGTLAEETTFLSYAIEHKFNEPASAIIVLADPTGSIMQKYDIDLAKDLAGGVADDGGVETDETTETNSAAANDMTLMQAAPVVNDAYYFGFDEEISGFTLNVGTAGDEGAGAGWTITWEYSQGADAWAALAGVTDGTNKFLNAGENTVVWTIPGDWATDEVGSISGKYWIRGRVSAYASMDIQPLGTQAWYNEVYVGPGRAKIEDPTGTCIFEGRIIKAIHLPARMILHCTDWLSQLDEDRINYDIREDLDGNGLRESYAHGDANNATYVGVAYTNGADYYMYDDNMDWAADQFNPNHYLVFTSGMAGKNTWTFHPYDSTATDHDVYGDDPHLLWVDDDPADVGFANNDWTLDYHFRVYLGHDTPSDFYVHNSISGARIKCVHKVSVVPSTNHAHVMIYENDTPAWLELEHVDEDDLFGRDSHDVNEDWLAHIVDNTGIVNIRYDMDRTAGNATISLKYLALELDVETTGYSSTVTISDTLDLNGHGGKVNCLKVGTDLTATATRIWEGMPYSIVKKIKDKIGAIITGYDPLFTLDTSIEATDGISTRNYQERTALEILKDLADVDKAVFYIALADHTTPTVIWKRTFAGGITEMTDASVLAWLSGEYDYAPMVNEYHVYGVRIGDSPLYVDTGALATDPGVDSKALFGATRSATVKNPGTVSEYECEELGKAMVERDEDVHLYLRASLAGLSSLRLGSEVNINSTLLGLTDQKYVVTHWSYDSTAYRTMVRFHPRQSTGFIKHKMFGEHIRHVIDEGKLHKVDKSTPSLSTQTWT